MIGRDLRVHALRRFGRAVLRTAAGTVAFVVLALAWSLTGTDGASGTGAGTAGGGWGHEALGGSGGAMRAASPVALANACGMGASSCFKCHNGTRAAAPRTEKWHTEHKSVNDSCVGCHMGNPRLIKADLAHAGLLRDSRTRPERCTTCHRGGNAGVLLQAYRK